MPKYGAAGVGRGAVSSSAAASSSSTSSSSNSSASPSKRASRSAAAAAAAAAADVEQDENFSHHQQRIYENMPLPLPEAENPETPRKVAELGLLSKQAYLLVLKTKLSAISRHLRRFDAAIALVRAEEAKRKAGSNTRQRSSAEANAVRKKYQQVKACQARHELIARRREKRRVTLGRDPEVLTPVVPSVLLRKAWTRPLAPVPPPVEESEDEEDEYEEAQLIGNKRSRFQSVYSSGMPASALHVPTVVFSTVLMEMREGPRSPAMLLKTLMHNLPGGPRMAKKLLRKVETTFAVLSGFGLIKPFVPPATVKDTPRATPAMCAPKASPGAPEAAAASVTSSVAANATPAAVTTTGTSDAAPAGGSAISASASVSSTPVASETQEAGSPATSSETASSSSNSATGLPPSSPSPSAPLPPPASGAATAAAASTTAATRAKKGYHFFSLFVLDKQQDLVLGNVDLFTHRLLTVKHRIYKQQKLEEKLLAELEKEYGLNIDLDGLVKAQQRRGLIDLTASMRPSKRQKLPMQAVDIANVKGMAAAAVPHGAAWDITFPDPMTLFADLKKRSVTKEDDNSNSKNNANDSADSSVNSGEGAATATAVVTSDEASTNSGGGSSNSDESSSSGSSNIVAVSVAGATDSDQPPSQTSPPASKLAPVSSAALARQKPKPHPFSIESLRAASSQLSPVALAERAATNYDDIDRMRAILSHLQRRSGLLEQQRADRLMAGGRLGGSKNAKPKKKRYHFAQPQAPRLLPPTPGIVLAPGVGFLPQKSEMIQAQNAAFTKHTSGRGRKGQVALRASTQDGSPAVHVQKFADKGVASEIEIMNNRLIPWSHIVAKFTDLTAADMSSLAAAAAQSASMSGRSETAMALRRRKSTTVPVPRWNLVEKMEGGIDVEEDESMLQDRVYEKRHVAHLAEMQMAFEKARAEQEQKKREKVAARQSAAIANRNNRVAGRGSPRASPMRSRFGQSPMAGPAASKKRKRVISEIGLPPSRVVAGAGAAGSLSKGAGLASSMSPPAAQGRGTRPKATRNTTKAKKARVTRRSAAAASASPLPVRASKRSKRGRGRQ